MSLFTFNVTVSVTLPVIATDAAEARALMRDHWATWPPDWLHLRMDEYRVTRGNDADAELAINAGRFEDEEEEHVHPEPPEELADAWRRFQAGEDVPGHELRRLDEWRADAREEALGW